VGSPSGSWSGLFGGSCAGGDGGSCRGAGVGWLGAFGFWATETFLSIVDPYSVRGGARAGSVERRATVEPGGLFHPTAVKIALVCCVLLDIGSLPLLGNILRFGMLHGIIRERFGFAAGPLVAATGGRYRRHVLGHCDSSNRDFGIKTQGHNRDMRHSFRIGKPAPFSRLPRGSCRPKNAS
jgi:hypothetical protein